MLIEIRNYHYEPQKFSAYKSWAVCEAVPFLKKKFDVIGFWINTEDEPEVYGKDKMDLKHGSANVTWVIRWQDMAARKAGHKALEQDKRWLEIWSRHPDPNGYLQMEAKFAEAL